MQAEARRECNTSLGNGRTRSGLLVAVAELAGLTGIRYPIGAMMRRPTRPITLHQGPPGNKDKRLVHTMPNRWHETAERARRLGKLEKLCEVTARVMSEGMRGNGGEP